MVNIMLSFNRLRTGFRKMWAQSVPLTFTAALMLVAFLISLLGLVLDSRVITGIPAWLKPAKFAISTAIFAGTIAWLTGYLTVWRRFVRFLGWVLSAVLIVEVAIIDLQAARGTTSHFNVATAFDRSLFAIMGIAIAILWLASVGVLVVLLRQRFTDPGWGWALRVGMLVTVLGSAAGGLMLRSQPEQRVGVTSGAHTVGAPDGGPGLPGLGWSTEHGDLRVPHFFGLHAIQLIPLTAWLISRRRHDRNSARTRLSAVIVITASYLALVAILAWQALQGQPITRPDGAVAIALAVWMASTVLATAAVRFISRAVPRSECTALVSRGSVFPRDSRGVHSTGAPRADDLALPWRR